MVPLSQILAKNELDMPSLTESDISRAERGELLRQKVLRRCPNSVWYPIQLFRVPTRNAEPNEMADQPQSSNLAPLNAPSVPLKRSWPVGGWTCSLGESLAPHSADGDACEGDGYGNGGVKR